MYEPLQSILCKRVRRIKRSPSRFPVANVATGHGDDGFAVGLRAGDVRVVLVGVDVEMVRLELVHAALRLVRLAGKHAGVDTGGFIVEGLENQVS